MTESQDQASADALSAMKLPQLQAVASELGLKGTSRLRKSDLIEAIKTHGEGQSSAKGGAKGGAKGEANAGVKSGANDTAPAAGRAPRGGAQQPEARRSPQQRDAGQHKAGQKQVEQRKAARNESAEQREQSQRGEPHAPKSAKEAPGPRQDRGGQRRQQRPSGEQQRPGGEQRGGRSEAKPGTLDVFAEFGAESKAEEQKVSNLDDIQLPGAEEEEQDSARRRRGRDRRDRKRRPGPRENQDNDEVDVTEGDTLVPVAGVLDVLDNYAFVRTTGYLPGSSDVYVNLGMVRRYGLRRGDAVTGSVKQPREGDGGGRQKFNALVTPEQVNNAPATESQQRPEFAALTTAYPEAFLSLGAQTLTRKVVDTLAPLALGQRVLVSVEPGAKRLKFLTEVAQGVAETKPNVHLMMVLIDERPEDATHLQRNIHGEVIASSFDRSGNDHTVVATLAIERAKRLVELGQDVVVVLDSLTALARAYHTSTAPSSRTLEHGVDAATIHAVKQVFGAGRNIENGGSLTLIATGMAGNDMGDLVLEELAPVANAHISLNSADSVMGDRALMVDPAASATRDLESIFDVDDLAPRIVLRRLLAEKGAKAGAEWLESDLKDKGAGQFLAESVKVTPREKAEIRRSLA